MNSTTVPVGRESRQYRINEQYQPEELGTIFQDIYSKIQNKCASIVQDDGVAEEITQETFLKVHATIGKFHGRCSLYKWVDRIATNRSIDYLREKKRNEAKTLFLEGILPDFIQSVPDTYLLNPEENLLQREFRDFFTRVMGSLPATDREILMLRYVDGLNATQIGVELGLLTSTVRGRVKRALSRLRQKLRSYNTSLLRTLSGSSFE